MADLRNATGARLAYVVVKLPGTVEREYTIHDKAKGLIKEMRPESAGYMVYFPRGHVIRIRTDAELDHYNIRPGEAPIINMQGLHDPRSPIGRLLASQDEKVRAKAWTDLEDNVVRLATARTGTMLMPEQGARRPD